MASFKDIKEQHYPAIIPLETKYIECQNKLNKFEKDYNNKYLEIFTLIKENKHEILNEKLSELNEFVRVSQESIETCFKHLKDQNVKMMTGNTDDYNNSELKKIYDDTNDIYHKYQGKLVKLREMKTKLLKTIEDYNAAEATLMGASDVDGPLSYFYIWFLICVMLITYTFLNILNINLGIINKILMLVTILVVLYFITSNLFRFF
jgi:hypothetical protein